MNRCALLCVFALSLAGPLSRPSSLVAQVSPLDDPHFLSLAPPDLLTSYGSGDPVPGWSPAPVPLPIEPLAPEALPPAYADEQGEFDPHVQPASFAEATANAPAADSAMKKEFDALRKQVEKLEAAAEKRKTDEEKRPTAKITAQFQHDSVYVNQGLANRQAVGNAVGGEAFRRARVGVFGSYSITEYRVEVDFALAGRPSFLDVWAAVNDLPVVGQVKAGHFFEPFLLERLTANRFVTFMERALPDAFAPARNTGVMAQRILEDQRLLMSGGVFRTNSDVFGDDVGEYDEISVDGRVAWLAYFDEASEGRYYWHLGAAGSFRGADASTVRFRSRPEATVGSTLAIPVFIDTGNITAETYQLYGLESAWVNGPFSIVGEYVWAPVQQKDAPDPTLTGWYVQTSYFLTGEHRPYDKTRGTFNRVEPFENFFRVRTDRGVQMGRGAWELAARVSNLNFDSQNIQRGDLTDLTLGVNWYMTPYLRVTGNYVHAFLDSPVNGHNGADVVAARIGYEF